MTPTMSKLLRAEYWWQPAQLPRRFWRRATVGRRTTTTIRLPWGGAIDVDPHESIGKSIVALNALDLPVTEALWRLVDPGETCADVGANIGYMTSVMAARLRTGGAIWSFEPLPSVAARLRAHVVAWQSLGQARIHIREFAVCDRNGPGTLYLPSWFATNQGTASLSPSGFEQVSTAIPPRQIPVDCATLDTLMHEARTIHVLKVDVEGLESAVFRGAQALLDQERIRDIVFEEHRPLPADSVSFLESKGFAVWRVMRGLLGPHLAAATEQPKHDLDPPTYLATKNPARAKARFARAGWRSLTA